MYNSGDGRICTFCLRYKIVDKFNCSDPYIWQSIVSYLPKYLYPNVFKAFESKEYENVDKSM